jgi:hypothetical protein
MTQRSAFQVSDEAHGLRVRGGGIWRAGGTGAPVGHYIVETDGPTGERRVVCYLEPAWRTAEVAIATAVRAALAPAEGPIPAIRFQWLVGSAAPDGTPAVRPSVTAVPGPDSSADDRRTAAGRGAQSMSRGGPEAGDSRSTVDRPAGPKPRRPPRLSPYVPASGSVAVGGLLLASYVYRLLAFVGIDESGSALWQTVLAGFLCLAGGLVCLILDSPLAYLGNAVLLAAIGGLNMRNAGAPGWDSLVPFAAAALHGVAALLRLRSFRAAGD